MMVLRRIALLLAAFAALVLLVFGPRGPVVAYAADPTQGDAIKWTAINIMPGPSSGPGASIHFQAQVAYTLRTAPSGFITMFVFENNTNTSAMHSPQIQTVGTGSGTVNLDLVYQPHGGVQSLTLFAGIFRDDQSLLGWVASDSIALSMWEAKEAFVNSLAHEQAKDYAGAVNDLSVAIALAPEVSNFYYWRADNESRLSQYPAAIADYTEALRLTPGDRPSLLGRGIATLWRGDPAGAVPDLSAVIEGSAASDQLTAWALRARGIARADLGQNAAAVADYQSYLGLAPTASDRSQVEGWIARLKNGSSG
jgi:tetratricopeptide (TPR) repeat protein